MYVIMCLFKIESEYDYKEWRLVIEPLHLDEQF